MPLGRKVPAMSTLPRLRLQYYRDSVPLCWRNVRTWMPVFLLTSSVLAIGYGLVRAHTSRIWLNLLLLVPFAIGLVVAGYFLGRGLAGRDQWIVTLFGGSCGLMAAYLSWAAFLSRIGEVSLATIVTQPSLLWESATRLWQQGWYVWSGKVVEGAILQGGLSLIEVLLIVGCHVVAVRMAFDMISPYCTRCREFVKLRERVIGIPADEEVFTEGAEAAMVRSLADSDWSPFETAYPLENPSMQPSLLVSLGRCEGCRGPFVMMVEWHGKSVTTGALHTGSILTTEVQESSVEGLLKICRQRRLAIRPQVAAVEALV